MTEFSFQLYSARNFQPIEAILPRLAALGYKQVEAYAGLFDAPEALAKSVKASGLTMPTAHIGLDMLKDAGKTINACGVLGIKTIYVPAIGEAERARDEAGFAKLGETLATLAVIYNKAGFGFGWHNHDFEFAPTASGALPMNIILDTVPMLEWEVDLAWLVRGKQAPFDWFKKYGPRITAIHVKDLALTGENEDEDGWADVGYGTLDWPELYSAITAQTAARYFVMEHDNPKDVVRFARRSIETAKSWK